MHQSKSPHKQVLTGITRKIKKLIHNVIAKNPAQVITWLHKSHHQQIRHLQPTYYKSTHINQSHSPQNRYWLLYEFKKLSQSTLLQTMLHRSSLICTQVIHKKWDRF